MHKKRKKFAIFSRVKEEIIDTHKMHDCKIIEETKKMFKSVNEMCV